MKTHIKLNLYFILDDQDSDTDTLMKAGRSLLVIVPTPPRGDRYEEFEDKVRYYNAEKPFKFMSSELFPDMVVVSILVLSLFILKRLL